MKGGNSGLCYLGSNYLVQSLYIEGIGGSCAEGVENVLLERITYEANRRTRNQAQSAKCVMIKGKTCNT